MYEIRNWWRVSTTTFTGELYKDGVKDCTVVLATVSVTELSDRFVLEHLGHRYTLLKQYRKRSAP